MAGKVVRVGNAGGYWGDDPDALLAQVTGGPLDYLTMDFLAEITMVILHRQRARDPSRGYAYDFVPQLARALPAIVERGVRVVVNAGGVNVRGCRDRVAEICRSRGYNLAIAAVEGDDLLPVLDELLARGEKLAHLDDGRPLAAVRDRVVAANAYLGARPLVEALAAGADIVIAGRTTDAALTLAPLVYEHGWGWEDWDRLAAGVVAGHLLECGAQVTGGNLTDWQALGGPVAVGYPIAEVYEDGNFVVTKHPATGGAVSRKTVVEQLLYEIGDPRAYLTPDVTVDLTGLALEEEAPDRVRIRGARGGPPPDTLKVSVVHREGWRAVGTVLLSGPDILAKAAWLEAMLWNRLGGEPYTERRVDLVGYRSCWGKEGPGPEPAEGLLRAGVRAAERAPVERFSRTLLGFGLQGPPGLGIFGGRPEVQEAYAYWPALVRADALRVRVEVARGGKAEVRECPAAGSGKLAGAAAPRPQGRREVAAGPAPAAARGPARRVALRRIAYGRSGDKGDHCNIGVAARSPAAYAFLREALTPERVRSRFADLCRGEVERYELPNLLALNFVLRHALGGGGTLSLRVDHQGKTLAQGLLATEIEVPEAVLAETPGA